MIERETDHHVWVRTLKPFRDMLRDHKIFTAMDINLDRFSDRNVVWFQRDCSIEPYVGIFQGEVLCSMGALSYSNSALHPALTIGRYCSLGGRINWPGARHPIEAVSTSTAFYFGRSSNVSAAWADAGRTRPHTATYIYPDKPPPVLGNDVWVGQDVTFLNGVVVGDGAAIGTQALVSKSVEDFSIMGGNPAKHIRHRFPEGVRQRLKATRWWQYGMADLLDMPMHEPTAFLEAFERRGPMEPWNPAPLRVWDEVRRIA
ncbi:CatB-related O-acetyltransferase [Roseomonas sp. BN140053]|uniref:CatB-related O-acetyltransferase n=1 Tax=Roseomonas sp. BN140053 TaxID=3391898 RepID=UPI0039ED707E